ncbi:MAG: hypothetical protein ACLUE1_09395 [Adlercreutzia equolifaciens]
MALPHPQGHEDASPTPAPSSRRGDQLSYGRCHRVRRADDLGNATATPTPCPWHHRELHRRLRLHDAGNLRAPFGEEADNLTVYARHTDEGS